MMVKNKDYYSADCLNTQLNKLRQFYGIKSQFIHLTYIDLKDEQKNLKITKYTWSCFETGNHKPDLYRLLLIAHYLRVKIEYFFIEDAEPKDFIETEFLNVKSVHDNAWDNDDNQNYSVEFLSVQLTKMRLFRGYSTQKQVAETFKISNKTWSKWESGKCQPNAKQLLHLSIFFKVKIDYFFINNASPGDYIHKNDNDIPFDDKKMKNPTSDVKFISLQLKKIRLFFNFKSQIVPCKHLNIARQGWSLIETGKRIPDLKQLVALSNYFEIRMEYFFIFEAEPEYFINKEYLEKAYRFLKSSNEEVESKYTISNLYVRLKHLLQFHGYDKATLLRKELKIRYRKWMQWEQNKDAPPLERVVQLANFFGVRIEYFLTQDTAVEDYVIDHIMPGSPE